MSGLKWPDWQALQLLSHLQRATTLEGRALLEKSNESLLSNFRVELGVEGVDRREQNRTDRVPRGPLHYHRHVEVDYLIVEPVKALQQLSFTLYCSLCRISLSKQNCKYVPLIMDWTAEPQSRSSLQSQLIFFHEYAALILIDFKKWNFIFFVL